MLIASLSAALAALAVCCLGLLGFCLWLLRQQRRQAQQQQLADAERDRRIAELRQRLDACVEGDLRMGEQLRELDRLVAPLPERLNQLAQRDPANLSFSQAARLVDLGASVDELTQSCGLSQSEAELVSRLHRARKPS